MNKLPERLKLGLLFAGIDTHDVMDWQEVDGQYFVQLKPTGVVDIHIHIQKADHEDN